MMKDTLNVKTDEESIYLLCNTLNAIQGSVRFYDQRLADVLLRAQGTIMALHEELKELKGETGNGND